MIIPVKCFTCNKLLGNKWNEYKKESSRIKEEKENSKITEEESINQSMKLFEKLDLNRYCCRSVIMSTLDMTDIIL